MDPHFRANMRAKLSDQAKLRQESHFCDRLERKAVLECEASPMEIATHVTHAKRTDSCPESEDHEATRPFQLGL